MSIHYKKEAWHEVIDPAFDTVIKKYLETLRLINLPSSEGHISLALPEESLIRIRKQGYPRMTKFYEQENVKTVIDDLGLMFSFDTKDIQLKVKSKKKEREQKTFQNFIQAFILPMARMINKDKDCNYYMRTFEPWKSKRSLKAYIKDMDDESIKKYREKVTCDIYSILWHIGMSKIDELEKENEFTARLRVNISNDSKMIRRMLFFVWDTICMMNHKKSIRQLYRQARDKSDNDALIALFQYDPTLFDHDWVRERIRVALYSGDAKLISDIGKQLQRGSLETGKDNLDISIALMMFWTAGISRLSDRQKMELLRDSGIRFTQDYNSFRQIVRRIRPFLQ